MISHIFQRPISKVRHFLSKLRLQIKGNARDLPLREYATTDQLCFAARLNIVALRHGHQLLRDEATKYKTLSPLDSHGKEKAEVACMLLGHGFLMQLAVLDDILSALEYRAASLTSRISRLKGQRKKWRHMRDDAAHSFARLYRERRLGSNDPEDEVLGPRAAYYSRENDRFETGSGALLEIKDAIDRAEELVDLCCPGKRR